MIESVEECKAICCNGHGKCLPCRIAIRETIIFAPVTVAVVPVGRGNRLEPGGSNNGQAIERGTKRFANEFETAEALHSGEDVG
jgi:hypothetical protein